MIQLLTLEAEEEDDEEPGSKVGYSLRGSDRQWDLMRGSGKALGIRHFDKYASYEPIRGHI